MAKHKHLTLSNRITIESILHAKASFKSVGLVLDKDHATISKEIRSHLSTRRTGEKGMGYNSCRLRFSCTKSRLCSPCHAQRKYSLCRHCSMCNSFCPDFQMEVCRKLTAPPYVCNGCGMRIACRLKKRLYSDADAQEAYGRLLSEAGTGISLSEEAVRRLDTVEGRKGNPVFLTIHFVKTGSAGHGCSTVSPLLHTKNVPLYFYTFPKISTVISASVSK